MSAFAVAIGAKADLVCIRLLVTAGSTGRRNTLSHSFCWDLNAEILRHCRQSRSAGFSAAADFEKASSFRHTPSFSFKTESVASTG